MMTTPTHYGLARSWQWTRRLHLLTDAGRLCCGLDAVARIDAATVRQTLGPDPARWPVCGNCERATEARQQQGQGAR